MTGSDAVRFEVAFLKFWASRAGAEPGQVEREAYWEALEDLEIARVELGFREATKQPGAFRPSAGEVRAAALKAPLPYHGPFLPPVEWKRDPAWDKPEVREELAQLKASLRERGVLAVSLDVAERAMTGGKEGNS